MQELEAECGVMNHGDLDDQHLGPPMTEERYLAAETADTAFNARRFLACGLSLNRLFTGTGYGTWLWDRIGHYGFEIESACRLGVRAVG